MNSKDDVRDFLKGQVVMTLCTVDKQGLPHATMVTFCADKDFNVYALLRSQKDSFQNILANKHVALEIGDHKQAVTVQITGEGSEVDFTDGAHAEKIQLLADKMNKINRFVVPPVDQLPEGSAKLIVIRPTKLIAYDFNQFKNAGPRIIEASFEA